MASRSTNPGNESTQDSRELLRRLLAEEADNAPASSGQRSLWLVEQLGTRPGTYNIFQAVRLHGVLDIPALEMVFASAVCAIDSMIKTPGITA